MKWFVDENGLSHSKSVLAEEMNGLINKAQRFEANNPNLDPDLDDVLDETLLPESQRSPIESHEPSYKVREILEPYPLVHHTVARNFISNVPFNSFLRGNRDTSKHMPVSGHIYALEHCPNLGNPSSLQSDLAIQNQIDPTLRFYQTSKTVLDELKTGLSLGDTTIPIMTAKGKQIADHEPRTRAKKRQASSIKQVPYKKQQTEDFRVEATSPKWLPKNK
ncbi:hypothetical protein LINGRAHAP2_LOCUS8129 [Linum grandiflorum]